MKTRKELAEIADKAEELWNDADDRLEESVKVERLARLEYHKALEARDASLH